MITIKEVSEGEFNAVTYDIVIGEYATYNHYYIITIKDSKNLDLQIGLQSIFVGIKPQIEICKSYIIIGAGEQFYAYKLDGTLVIKYEIGSAFYSFIFVKESILVSSELSVIFFDGNFKQVWRVDFEEVIDVTEVDDNIVRLNDYNGKTILLDMKTGAYIN